MNKVLLPLLSIGIICGLIWGFYKVDCPKCNGSGEFSKEVEYQEPCSNCSGKGDVFCDYYDDNFKSSYVTCKGGTAYYYTMQIKWLGNQNPTYYLKETYTCPQCNGTKYAKCKECNGYGYFKKTKTEYNDDHFCNGEGKVKNFKILFD